MRVSDQGWWPGPGRGTPWLRPGTAGHALSLLAGPQAVLHQPGGAELPWGTLQHPAPDRPLH